MHDTDNTDKACITQATQGARHTARRGHRFTFSHSKGMLSKLATRGLLPNARWARCLSAHRAAVHLRLLVGGEDRLPGGAANQMAAPQRHDSNVNQKRRVRRMRVVSACAPLSCPQRLCLSQQPRCQG